MTCEKLTSLLWRERELLDLLLFKLEIEELVLAGGKSHRLAAAAREVEAVLEAIRDAELLRAVAVDAVGYDLRLGLNPSLREIAEASREPWQSIWLDHREAFTTVSRQLAELAHSNRALLSAGYQAVQATLLSLTETSAAYGPDVAGLPSQLGRLDPLR